MFVKHKWVIVRLSTQDALRLSFAHTAGAFPESGCCALICSHQEVIKQLYAYIHAYIYITSYSWKSSWRYIYHWLVVFCSLHDFSFAKWGRYHVTLTGQQRCRMNCGNSRCWLATWKFSPRCFLTWHLSKHDENIREVFPNPTVDIWLVVWNIFLLFHILGISSSQVTNSYFSEA